MEFKRAPLDLWLCILQRHRKDSRHTLPLRPKGPRMIRSGSNTLSQTLNPLNFPSTFFKPPPFLNVNIPRQMHEHALTQACVLNTSPRHSSCVRLDHETASDEKQLHDISGRETKKPRRP